MDNTTILLDSNASDKYKDQAANNIINTNNLNLSVKQMLYAHNKILYHKYERNMNNHIFLLNKILDININMYTAIIIALCGSFYDNDLVAFAIHDNNNGNYIDIGLECDRDLYYYIKLLNYYEFDVSNIPNISDENKRKIGEYRQQKYSGKFTKRALKNN